MLSAVQEEQSSVGPDQSESKQGISRWDLPLGVHALNDTPSPLIPERLTEQSNATNGKGLVWRSIILVVRVNSWSICAPRSWLSLLVSIPTMLPGAVVSLDACVISAT